MSKEELTVYNEDVIYKGKYYDHSINEWKWSVFIKTEQEDVYKEVLFGNLYTPRLKAFLKETCHETPYQPALIQKHFNQYFGDFMKEFLSLSYTEQDILDVLSIFVMLSNGQISENELKKMNEAVSIASTSCVENMNEQPQERQTKKFKESLENRLRRQILVNSKDPINKEKQISISEDLLLQACQEASIKPTVFFKKLGIIIELDNQKEIQNKELKKTS